MPRSMRKTFANPQLLAIFVARDAQGEIVPMRGMTKNNSFLAYIILASPEAAWILASKASLACSP